MESSPADGRVGALETQDSQSLWGPGGRSAATRRQLLLAFVANLTTLGAGLSLGFSAVALPPLRDPNAKPSVDEDQASWIASVAAIATPLGCLLAGPLLDRWGRRAALLAVNVPCLLGWLLLGSAPTPAEPGPADAGFLAQVYVGRVLTGIATGMASLPATVYCAEMAAPGLRGLLVTWTSAAIAFGVLLVYALGWLLQERWRSAALACAVLPAAAGLLALRLPESPAWLAGRGRLPAAESALRRARALPRCAPTPPAMRQELLVQSQQAEARKAAAKTATEEGRGGVVRRALAAVRMPAVWKPLLILNMFFLFQQVSGVFVVIFYAVDVALAAGVAIDAYTTTVLIGAARALVTVATGFASQRFGRRPPALVSGAGMAASAAALGVWLWLTSSTVSGPAPGPGPIPASAPATEAWTPLLVASTVAAVASTDGNASAAPVTLLSTAASSLSEPTPGLVNASNFFPNLSELDSAIGVISNASAALSKLPALTDAVAAISNASARLPSFSDGFLSLSEALGRGADVPLLPIASALEAPAPTPPAAWLPATALLLYIATSTVGFLTLPWAMLGELFPASARGLAGGFTTCMAYVFSFVMLKLYPSMLHAMGAAGLFLFYAAAALAGTLYVAAFLPETRGRTLREIEEMFAGRGFESAPPEGKASSELRATELLPLAGNR